jgi:hypothetical protein
VPDEVFLDQRLERLEIGVEHGLGGLERAAAGEHREASEQPLLVRIEQVVRPRNRRAERLLARVGVAASPKEVQPLGEAVEDLLRREDLRPGSRELERERHAVETAAELRDRAAPPQPGTEAEQLDRVRLGEREHFVLDLAAHAKELPRRHEHLQMRTRLDESRNVARGLDDMLEVVQQQQQLLVADDGRELLARAERLSDRRQDELRVADRRQQDPVDTVREVADDVGRSLDREACLARPARPGESEQPTLAAQQLGDVCYLTLSTDERAGRPREVRVRDRLQRRKRHIPELEDPDRLVEVLQPVLSQIADLAVELLARRLREQHLASVTAGGDPGGEMNVETDVALLCDCGRTRVQAHPDANRPAAERRLGVRSRGDGLACVFEDDEERVALRADLDPAVCRERLAQQPPVLRERARVLVPELVQQPRRALDVREQQRDRSARELAHGRISALCRCGV